MSDDFVELVCVKEEPIEMVSSDDQISDDESNFAEDNLPYQHHVNGIAERCEEKVEIKHEPLSEEEEVVEEDSIASQTSAKPTSLPVISNVHSLRNQAPPPLRRVTRHPSATQQAVKIEPVDDPPSGNRRKHQSLVNGIAERCEEKVQIKQEPLSEEEEEEEEEEVVEEDSITSQTSAVPTSLPVISNVHSLRNQAPPPLRRVTRHSSVTQHPAATQQAVKVKTEPVDEGSSRKRINRSSMGRFERAEKALLEKICQKYTVLHDKSYSGEIISKKQEAWMKIVEEYNACNPEKPPRDVPQLRGLWKRLKIEAKKTRSSLPAVDNLNTVVPQVAGMLEPLCDPLKMGYDDDSIAFQEGPSTVPISAATSTTSPVPCQQKRSPTSVIKNRKKKTYEELLMDMAWIEHKEKMSLLKLKKRLIIEKIKSQRSLRKSNQGHEN